MINDFERLLTIVVGVQRRSAIKRDIIVITVNKVHNLGQYDAQFHMKGGGPSVVSTDEDHRRIIALNKDNALGTATFFVCMMPQMNTL